MPPNRTLSDEDIAALAKIIIESSKRNPGLSPEEVMTAKKLISAFDNAASIVGKVVLTTIVVTLIGIMTKGFWTQIIEGIKQGSR